MKYVLINCKGSGQQSDISNSAFRESEIRADFGQSLQVIGAPHACGFQAQLYRALNRKWLK